MRELIIVGQVNTMGLDEKSEQVFQRNVCYKERGDIKQAPKQGNIVFFDVSLFAHTQQFCLNCFQQQLVIPPPKNFQIALTEKKKQTGKKIRQRKFGPPFLAFTRASNSRHIASSKQSFLFTICLW